MGLEDYYDYDPDGRYNVGGLGSADMMDYTVGDHNPFSKMSPRLGHSARRHFLYDGGHPSLHRKRRGHSVDQRMEELDLRRIPAHLLLHADGSERGRHRHHVLDLRHRGLSRLRQDRQRLPGQRLLHHLQQQQHRHKEQTDPLRRSRRHLGYRKQKTTPGRPTATSSNRAMSFADRSCPRSTGTTRPRT
ncbi:MAG: hypothetical protein MZU97_10005 [Bacillus subtilis]|nr:hypothetical protein [Bacillus subtilis]